MDNQAVVIDNGSGLLKAGFSGEDKPRAVFASIVGHPNSKSVVVGISKKGYIVGTEAQSKRGVLSLRFPVEHGVIKHWDDMEEIWQYTYENELRVDPADHNVLLTEASLNPKSNRKKMAEIMFEKFQVPALYVATQAILSLYASGRTTGLLLDSGDGITHTVPVYEGYTQPYAIGRIRLAGRDLTDHLTRLLLEKGEEMSGSSEREIVREMKEKLCYVATDYQDELDRAKKDDSKIQKHYELPDGRKIVLDTERFTCPEALFTPSLIGSQAPGIQTLVLNTIMKSGMDTRRDLFSNIVLSGGSTLFKNLEYRLEKELMKAIPGNTFKIKVVAQPERKYFVWIGGAILSSLPSFQPMWVTRKEFEEKGCDVMYASCV